jgi:hypothetical protein
MSERLPCDSDWRDDPDTAAALGCLYVPQLIGEVIVPLVIGWAFLRQGEIAYGLPCLILAGAFAAGWVIWLQRVRRRARRRAVPSPTSPPQ